MHESEGMVACRELGYTGGYGFYGPPYFNAPALELNWMYNLTCNGTESRIRDCLYEGLEGMKVRRDFTKPAYVRCYDDPSNTRKQQNFHYLLIILINIHHPVCIISLYYEKLT